MVGNWKLRYAKALQDKAAWALGMASTASNHPGLKLTGLMYNPQGYPSPVWRKVSQD